MPEGERKAGACLAFCKFTTAGWLVYSPYHFVTFFVQFFIIFVYYFADKSETVLPKGERKAGAWAFCKFTAAGRLVGWPVFGFYKCNKWLTQPIGQQQATVKFNVEW